MKKENVPYELREIVVTPDRLLLDPNNPRLQQRATSPSSYKASTLANDQLQERLRTSLLDKEHSVTRLVNSIKEHGFVNIDSIFVKHIPSVDKYLVIEGNRRVTAIKTILSTPTGVKSSSLASLNKIPVKELICDDEDFFSEMKEFILSIRHIFGVKEWAPMQKAHSIYAAYFEKYKKLSGNSKFRYVPAVATAFAPTMNLEPKEVRTAVSVYGLFTQLQEADFGVKSDHYSMLEMLISRPSLASKLFDFEQASCQMSDFGMDLFNDLCIEQGCEISNPKKFRLLYKIWKEGGLRFVEEVARGGTSVEKVAKIVDKKNTEFEAETKLKKIKTSLEKIETSRLKGTAREKQVIDEILMLLNERFAPIFRRP